MDKQLKQRVVGAAVLVMLGVIFIPLFLDQGDLNTDVDDVADVPAMPEDDFSSRVIPLDETEIERLGQRTSLRLPPEVVEQTPSEDVDNSQLEPPPVVSSTSESTPAVVEAVAESAEVAEPDNTPEPPAVAAAAPDTVGDIKPPRETVDAWTVQLGSFSSDTNARALIKKLRDADYPAYLERRVDGDVTAFKVRVGPQIDRKNAEQIRDRLHKTFKLKGMLLRYR